MAETKAVATYRATLIEALVDRRSKIRRGVTPPIDQNGNVITTRGPTVPPWSAPILSILATRAANGELTRMIHLLEEEDTD